jgi:hypothetical protein
MAESFLEPRIAKIYTDKIQGRETQGYTWASQATMDFQIPSQASLHGIVNPIAHFATQMALLCSGISWKIWGYAFFLSGEML